MLSGMEERKGPEVAGYVSVSKMEVGFESPWLSQKEAKFRTGWWSLRHLSFPATSLQPASSGSKKKS